MLKLYLLWSVIYLPPAIVERLHAGKSVAYNLLHYAKGLILSGEHYNSWILWYLLSSFYALLFISFLVKRKQSPVRILAIGCVLFVSYLALNALCDYANMLPSGLQKLLPLIQSTVGRGKPLQGFLLIREKYACATGGNFIRCALCSVLFYRASRGQSVAAHHRYRVFWADRFHPLAGWQSLSCSAQIQHRHIFYSPVLLDVLLPCVLRPKNIWPCGIFGHNTAIRHTHDPLAYRKPPNPPAQKQTNNNTINAKRPRRAYILRGIFAIICYSEKQGTVPCSKTKKTLQKESL